MSHLPLIKPFAASLTFLLFVAGCDETDPSPDGGGGSGGEGAEGGQGAEGGEGGAPVEGGGGNGGEGGGSAALPQCGPSESRLEGSFDGEAITASYVSHGYARPDASYVSFGDLGVLLLSEGEGQDEWVSGEGWVRMPDDGVMPGTWFCAGSGSAVRFGENGVDARLENLSSGGQCPGSSVAGEVTVCMDFEGELCEPGIASTVEGADFDITPNLFGMASGPIGGSTSLVEALGAAGLAIVEADDIDPDGVGLLTSTAARSFVVMPSGVPDANALYCAGEGTELEYRIEDGYVTPLRVTLRGLSRVGACPGEAIEGELGYCMDLSGE